MKTIEFLVQSSSHEPYLVTFAKEGNDVNAYCTCTAGKYGQYCKHRIAIMNGDRTGVISGTEQDIETVISWISGSDIEEALIALSEAERRYQKAKKELSAAKKNLAKAMRR